ncbi:hypothetical protein UA08_01305 [Talaromyces atroroseus]|uniref:Sialidase n=1 Tax=Talaromyces atroroseus TaxID=1441469 RepID=A0A1Q5Q9Y8_TALAT|nr:hypothetical protein UA08_01305 [Talaromyces atroroseus]OKL62746.1 hypothetical protein UA08_01305 [Talaromyces atroroseus]
MSQEEESFYLPTTPPGVARLHPSGSAHSRHTSGSSIRSVRSHDSSPESIITNITTPSSPGSPTHQHGPQLLPKIQTEDVDDPEPSPNVGPRRHRRVLSNTRNPPGYMPYPSTRPTSVSRNTLDASDCGASGGPVSPASPTPSTHDPTTIVISTSGLSSPIALSSPTATKRKSMSPATAARGHFRSVSASSIDGLNLSRCGYPTYRKLPKHASRPETSPSSPVDTTSFVFPGYAHVTSIRVPPPIQIPMHNAYHGPMSSPHYLRFVQGATEPSPVSFYVPPPRPCDSSTTLLANLTSVTPTINKVRTINHGPARGLQDYFWWDVRQLRHWSSFSMSTINKVCGLTQLLKTPVYEEPPETSIPSSHLTPESENSLINLIGDIFAPRVNAALRLSQGTSHIGLYVSPDAASAGGRNANGPHFKGNYTTDLDRTPSGTPRARVVGVAKSFDRWNSSMRNERAHRRVEYLRGLAHLQRCMREHSCRYGFIVTEVELVCVRAGCDDNLVPYFGYLEVSSPISMEAAAPGIISDAEDEKRGGDTNFFMNFNMDMDMDIHTDEDEDKNESEKMNGQGQETLNEGGNKNEENRTEDDIKDKSDNDNDNHSRRSDTPHLSADDNLTFGGSSSSSASVSTSPSPSLLPPPSPRDDSKPLRIGKGLGGVPMTVTMGLYFLLMLSKSVALPGHLPGYMNDVEPGTLARQRILTESKDKWIPEPQLGEKREARRVRGWIWPQDAWHRREGTRPKKHINIDNGEIKSKRLRNLKS